MLRTWLQARKLRRAKAERAVALAALNVALTRGDTRALHAALKPAKTATLAELALCVGRSPSAWRGR